MTASESVPLCPLPGYSGILIGVLWNLPLSCSKISVLGPPVAIHMTSIGY
jgi:hypothetical protein